MKYENEFFIIPHNYVYILHEHARREIYPVGNNIGYAIFGFKHHRILGVYAKKEHAEKAKERYITKTNPASMGYLAITRHKISELKIKRG